MTAACAAGVAGAGLHLECEPLWLKRREGVGSLALSAELVTPVLLHAIFD